MLRWVGRKIELVGDGGAAQNSMAEARVLLFNPFALSMRATFVDSGASKIEIIREDFTHHRKLTSCKGLQTQNGEDMCLAF